MKQAFLIVAILLLGGYSGVAAAQYDAIQVEEDLMVPMRDGVRLATDIYRPGKSGTPVPDRLPMLLQRTPYDKKAVNLVESARFFASHGYVVALQDSRGLYASEGVFTKYIGEGQDGFDTIEFLANLPYGDGQVGMWGTSYAAHVQANAAKLKPPHLKTMVLNMGGMSNGWDHKARNHGAFEIQQLTWAFRQLAVESDSPVVRDLLQIENINDWLTAMPLRKGQNPLSIAPNFEDYILEMMTHGDYDEYWKHIDLNWVEHYDKTIDVPMLLISGWYDSYAGGTIQNYLELRKRLDSPVKLIMGPWTHSGNTRSHAGNVEFGSAAAIDDFHTDFHLRWFDRYLKGDTGSKKMPDVNLFVMGSGDGHKNEADRLQHGGHWKEGDDWPLPGTTMTPYYFHADGGLRLSKPATDAKPVTFTFDPSDPVPTIGGAFSSTSPVFDPGAYNQRERPDVFAAKPPYLPLKSRSDVLVFQTDSLIEDVDVIGPVVVRLYVSSSAVDTDFTAKLVDVYPPSEDFPAGYEMNITDGIVRARYRNQPERQEFMEPGNVYEITVNPFPTANRFKAGHRIRVDISSSNFPRFDVNPNTGEPLGQHRRSVPADNTVYLDAKRPSHVILPLSPIN